jgi:hypothetical protein
MKTDITLQGLTRREMLKLSLAAGALGATATVLPGCSPPLDRAQDKYPIKNLSNLEYSVLSKAAGVVLPPRDSGLPDHRELPVLRNADHLFSTANAQGRKALGDALALFEYGAIVAGWHFKPFTRLSDEAAHEYLVSWRTGRTIQKAVYGAVTKVLIASYWMEDATWKPVHYAGPMHLRVQVAALGNAPLPQDRT